MNEKTLTNEQIETYRNALLGAECCIETALRTMNGLELNDDVGMLWSDLNHAYALVRTGLRKDHLLRDWGDR